MAPNINPTRRNVLVASGAALGSFAALGATSCTTSPISVLTGLVAAASTVVAALDKENLLGPDAAYITAASKFLSDLSIELASNDSVADKITKSLLLITPDLGTLPLPGQTGAIINIAILAVNAVLAFLKAQQPPVAGIAAHAAKAPLPADFTIPAKPTSNDKKALDFVVSQQKSVQAKIH